MKSSLTLPEWGNIVSSIYEAALQPEKWDQVILNIASPLNCHAGQFTAVNKKVDFNVFNSSQISMEKAYQDFDEEIKEGIHSRANFVLHESKPMTVITDYMHSSESDMAKDIFYQEGTAHNYNANYYGAIVLEKSEQSFLALACFRGKKDGHFQQEECQHLAMLAPHIKRSVELMRINRLQALTEGVLPVLNELEAGIFVLDNQAKIVELNNIARGFLKRQDGLYECNRRLNLRDAKAMKLLKEDMHGILSGEFSCPSGGFYINAKRSNPNRLPYSLMVIPLVSRVDQLAGFSMLLLICDPEEQSLNIRHKLVQLYGLTPSEVQLAEALYEGQSLKQIAEERGVSYETPRFHLKNIYSKMDIKRQSELIALLSKLKF